MIYEFKGFRLDAAQRRLFGPDGSGVELPSRAFELLLYMVERPGALLEKSELLEAVWPKSIVEESNLAQTVFVLRKTLGEQAGGSKFITTVSGRGYQFVAKVAISPPSVPQEAAAQISASAATTPHARQPIPGARNPRWGWLVAGAVPLVALLALLWRLHDAPPAIGATEPASLPIESQVRSIAVMPFAD